MVYVTVWWKSIPERKAQSTDFEVRANSLDSRTTCQCLNYREGGAVREEFCERRHDTHKGEIRSCSYMLGHGKEFGLIPSLLEGSSPKGYNDLKTLLWLLCRKLTVNGGGQLRG